MGRIAFVVSFERNNEDGENIADVKVDVGGGDVLLVEHFTPPGYDGVPLDGDYVATTSFPGGGEEVAVAYVDADNEPVAGAGEVRLYARDSTAAVVAHVYVKADGSIEISNDSGTMTLGADGKFNVNNNFEVDP
jgi:hypothetical protein